MLEFEVSTDVSRVEAEIRTRAIPGFRDAVMEATNDAAREAAIYAEFHAPVQSGKLKEAINFQKAVYRPGGAGGGGSWAAVVGVDETIAPHAEWLIHGTGLYGPDASTIYPDRPFSDSRSESTGRLKQSRMMFQKRGEEPKFRMSVSGMKPKDEWWEGAFDTARAVLAERLRRLGSTR